jgi:hypothetical protein
VPDNTVHPVRRRAAALGASATLAAALVAVLPASAQAADTIECPTNLITPLMYHFAYVLPALAPQSVVTPRTKLQGVGMFGAVAPNGVALHDARWFVDGVDSGMGSGSGAGTQFKVTVDHIGSVIQQIGVSVTYSAPGCVLTTIPATSPPVTVKAASSTRLTTVVRRNGVDARFRVAQDGTAAPKGFVTLAWKGRSKGTQIVRVAGKKAWRTHRITGLAAGKYTVTATFTDASGKALDSVSDAAKVRTTTPRKR